MQSCPRCGAPTQPGDLACPNCNEPLAARPPSAAGLLLSNTAPEAGLSPSSSNGARPSQSAAASPTNKARQENWGPGIWGPEQEHRGLPPYPGAGRAAGAPGLQPPAGVPARPPQARPAPWPPQQTAGTWAHPAGTPASRGAPVYATLPLPAPGYYPPGWYAYKPPQPPGESYRKVLSILALIASSLLMLGGLFILGVMLLLTLNGESEDLEIMNPLVMAALIALAGGTACLYHCIRSLMRRASAPFSLPSAWVWLGATIVAFGAGIALFVSGQPSGPLAMVLPLVLLAGILPAFTILALTQQRLRQQTSWRRLCLALVTGGTLGVLVGGGVELGMVAQLVRLFHLNDLSITSISADQLSDPRYFVALFLLLAVGAPLAEETSKQIGGFFLLPRIKGRSEAFLIGMAAGIGFNIVETSQYLGLAQADWIAVAIQRIGAGLIHGVGAAMAGLGWYYLFRGKTLSRRWKVGLGCLAYAYIQHGMLNGGELIVANQFPDLHVDVFGLHQDAGAFFALILYLAILVVLWRVTGWLRRVEPTVAPASTSASPPESAALTAAGANGAAPFGSDQRRGDANSVAARVGLASEAYRASQPPGQHTANPPGASSAASEREMPPKNNEQRPPTTEPGSESGQGGMA